MDRSAARKTYPTKDAQKKNGRDGRRNTTLEQAAPVRWGDFFRNVDFFSVPLRTSYKLTVKHLTEFNKVLPDMTIIGGNRPHSHPVSNSLRFLLYAETLRLAHTTSMYIVEIDANPARTNHLAKSFNLVSQDAGDWPLYQVLRFRVPADHHRAQGLCGGEHGRCLCVNEPNAWTHRPDCDYYAVFGKTRASGKDEESDANAPSDPWASRAPLGEGRFGQGCLVLVHSAYYYTAEEIFAMMEHYGCNQMISVHHVFKGAYGTFCGDTQWWRDAHGHVITSPEEPGETVYRHGIPRWMSEMTALPGRLALLPSTVISVGGSAIVRYGVTFMSQDHHDQTKQAYAAGPSEVRCDTCRTVHSRSVPEELVVIADGVFRRHTYSSLTNASSAARATVVAYLARGPNMPYEDVNECADQAVQIASRTFERRQLEALRTPAENLLLREMRRVHEDRGWYQWLALKAAGFARRGSMFTTPVAGAVGALAVVGLVSLMQLFSAASLGGLVLMALLAMLSSALPGASAAETEQIPTALSVWFDWEKLYFLMGVEFLLRRVFISTFLVVLAFIYLRLGNFFRNTAFRSRSCCVSLVSLPLALLFYWLCLAYMTGLWLVWTTPLGHVTYYFDVPLGVVVPEWVIMMRGAQAMEVTGFSATEQEDPTGAGFVVLGPLLLLAVCARKRGCKAPAAVQQGMDLYEGEAKIAPADWYAKGCSVPARVAGVLAGPYLGAQLPGMFVTQTNCSCDAIDGCLHRQVRKLTGTRLDSGSVRQLMGALFDAAGLVQAHLTVPRSDWFARLRPALQKRYVEGVQAGISEAMVKLLDSKRLEYWCFSKFERNHKRSGVQVRVRAPGSQDTVDLEVPGDERHARLICSEPDTTLLAEYGKTYKTLAERTKDYFNGAATRLVWMAGLDAAETVTRLSASGGFGFGVEADAVKCDSSRVGGLKEGWFTWAELHEFPELAATECPLVQEYTFRCRSTGARHRIRSEDPGQASGQGATTVANTRICGLVAAILIGALDVILDEPCHEMAADGTVVPAVADRAIERVERALALDGKQRVQALHEFVARSRVSVRPWRCLIYVCGDNLFLPCADPGYAELAASVLNRSPFTMQFEARADARSNLEFCSHLFLPHLPSVERPLGYLGLHMKPGRVLAKMFLLLDRTGDMPPPEEVTLDALNPAECMSRRWKRWLARNLREQVGGYHASCHRVPILAGVFRSETLEALGLSLTPRAVDEYRLQATDSDDLDYRAAVFHLAERYSITPELVIALEDDLAERAAAWGNCFLQPAEALLVQPANPLAAAWRRVYEVDA